MLAAKILCAITAYRKLWEGEEQGADRRKEEGKIFRGHQCQLNAA